MGEELTADSVQMGTDVQSADAAQMRADIQFADTAPTRADIQSIDAAPMGDIAVSPVDDVQITRLQMQDIDAVEKIERENYSLPWTAKAFSDALERDYYLFLKAEVGGVLAGYCGYQRSFEIADITNVTVHRDYRRRQIARRMLKTLMEEGRRQGIERFTLEVRRSNTPAIALYESLGFCVEGVRKGYYQSPKEDALILWTPEMER